jgi:hypothetical protein
MPSSQPFWQRHSLHRIGKPICTAAVDLGVPSASVVQKPLGPL